MHFFRSDPNKLRPSSDPTSGQSLSVSRGHRSRLGLHPRHLQPQATRAAHDTEACRHQFSNDQHQQSAPIKHHHHQSISTTIHHHQSASPLTITTISQSAHHTFQGAGRTSGVDLFGDALPCGNARPLRPPLNLRSSRSQGGAGVDLW